MVTLRKVFLALFASGMLMAGCLPDMEISKSSNPIATPGPKTFGGRVGCQLTYAIKGKYNKLNDEAQLMAVKKAFTLWQGAYPSLRFTDVTNATGVSNINIYFAFGSDSVVYKKTVSDGGFFTSSSTELSTVIQKSSREYAIYLNLDHEWDTTQISRAILFHSGYILGLPVSADPSSVMYPQLTEVPTAINDLDKASLKASYVSGCQIWMEHNIPFPGYYALNDKKIFQIKDRVFALIRDEHPKYLLFEFNVDRLAWEERKSLEIASPDWGIGIHNLFAFGSATKGYVGLATSIFNEQAASEPGELQIYDPVADTWTTSTDHPFPLKYRTNSPLYSFATDVSGYVMLDSGIPNNPVCWEIDLANNKWTQRESPIVPYIFNMIFTATAKKCYLMDYYNISYEFNSISRKWSSIPNSVTLSFSDRIALFSKNEDVYVVFELFQDKYDSNNDGIYKRQVYIFNADKGPGTPWELFATFPEKASTAQFQFGFVSKNRIFMYTNIGWDGNILWEYLP